MDNEIESPDALSTLASDPAAGIASQIVASELRTAAPVRPDDWQPPTWEEVVRLHSARVYRLSYRLTGNQHDAEDLTQEVFVRVFRSLTQYTPGTFEGWLHRITTNLFLDGVRRKQRIRFEGLGEDAPERLATKEPGPERAYDLRNLDPDVQQALSALPPEFRAAVVLCDVEGLSYEEIAATLGVKLGTVRSRIHRGRAALRDSLAHRKPERVVPASLGLVHTAAVPAVAAQAQVDDHHAAESATGLDHTSHSPGMTAP